MPAPGRKRWPRGPREPAGPPPPELPFTRRGGDARRPRVLAVAVLSAAALAGSWGLRRTDGGWRRGEVAPAGGRAAAGGRATNGTGGGAAGKGAVDPQQARLYAVLAKLSNVSSGRNISELVDEALPPDLRTRPVRPVKCGAGDVKTAAYLAAARERQTSRGRFRCYREAAADASQWSEDPCPGEGLRWTHVTLTLDPDYFVGFVALVGSVLRHAACPADVFFHLLTSSAHLGPETEFRITNAFPTLNYRVHLVDRLRLAERVPQVGAKYRFRKDQLEHPLNYARFFLPQLLPRCVAKTVYLDTDTLVVGEIDELYHTDVRYHVVGSPEFCHRRMHRYFSAAFWQSAAAAEVKRYRGACYFNPGVLVVNLELWQTQKVTQQLLRWMALQKAAVEGGREPLYHLGSLPPFLLAFAGRLAPVSAHWNFHDLGCPGICPACMSPDVRLLHFSCRNKPWYRLHPAWAGDTCARIDDGIWARFNVLGPEAIAALPAPEVRGEGEEEGGGPGGGSDVAANTTSGDAGGGGGGSPEAGRGGGADRVGGEARPPGT